ncbi:hypothetical protein M0638_03465 [Roseomonas sp. NAR14]|uniref:Uncharacterized protein n=1 Tax=Roseomonas acroporae TaxID=2937791 RepID=A0A9X1Y748_9PROT|nr:hypothetical protein [Roseomonas acroporae]MCK8783440.1 hypothetical protein [Roseomonas acroporae]
MAGAAADKALKAPAARRGGGRPAAGAAGTKPAPAKPPGKSAANSPGNKPRTGGLRHRARSAVAAISPRTRWMRVALLVSAPLLLLPIMHAFFGDVGAVIIGALVFGFLLGRWTMPAR